MKNLKVLFTVLVMTLLISACQKEKKSNVEIPLSDQEVLLQQLENGELPLATLVPASLEEINTEMAKYGLPTYSKEDIELSNSIANTRATSGECDAALALGDFNGDGYLSTLDMVRVLQHTSTCGFEDEAVDINAYDEVYCNNSYYNCGGTANSLEIMCPVRLIMAAFISYPNETNLVNDVDLQIMMDAILERCDD